MKTYKIRYRLNKTDAPKTLAVQAHNLNEAYDEAFAYIDCQHKLYTYAEREAVELDDGQSSSDPFAPAVA